MSEPADDLSALADADEEVRLQIARRLRRSPSPGAAAALKRALAREHVRWVRVALQEAILECEHATTTQGDSDVDDDIEERADTGQAYADGRRDGLRQALHEIAPLLGLARAAAETDLDEASPVRVELERMRAVTAALRQLVSASAVPERHEFDFGRLLNDLRVSPPCPCPDDVIGARGDSHYVVTGDRDLLELAVRPLLTNAIEAVLSVSPTPRALSVMLSYGSERKNYYVAIIDAGPGLAADADALTPQGVTTKEGHFGLGLETARTAIASLGGTLGLGPNPQGGTTAILRWPRPS